MKHFTNTRINILAAVAIAAAIQSGCFPRQLIIWSPDATRAVVMDANSTSICDGEGKLARLDVGATQAAAWMPDSKTVILAMSKSADTWTDLAKVLDTPTRHAVIAAADDLEKAILAEPADARLTDDDFEPIVKRIFENRGSLLSAALVYLRDAKPDALRKRLGEKWKDLDEMSTSYSQLRMFDLDNMSIKPGATILNSLLGIYGVRLAPNGQAVAYITGSDKTKEALTLWLAPATANATPRELADRVAMFPDWSTDGRYIAYIQSAGAKDGKPVQVATLSRRQVADDAGNLLDRLPKADDLAAVVFDTNQTARCLPDGRILFASADMTLPAVVEKAKKPISIFAFKPGQPASVARLIPAKRARQLPDNPIFQLSPDGKLICMTNSAKVAVLDLASGKATLVQRTEGKLQMLPSWRAPAELCFIVPATKDDPDARPEVALWSAGKTKIISKTWPNKVMEKLTFVPSPKQAITTAPATMPGQEDKGF